MNGRALGLNETGLENRESASGAPRAVDDEVRRAWAAALAASVPAEPVARALGLAGSTGSTGPWRPTDVSMTEMSDEVARAGGRPARPPSQPSLAVATRLETVVNTGALGKVSFVVDRSNAGLSIVVEVGNDAAAAAVDAERMTLLRTLRVAGLTVLSFRILVRTGSGTGLAQRSQSTHAKGASTSRGRYGQTSAEEDDDPECVDVVG